MRSLLMLATILLLSGVSIPSAAARQFKVVIIDSGFMPHKKQKTKLCKDGHYDALEDKKALTPTQDKHGTDVAESFSGRVEVDACVIVVKAIERGKTKGTQMVKALKYVSTLKADAVNMSVYPTLGLFELKRLAEKITQTMPIFMAAGNESANLDETCYVFPACFRLPNIFTIGAWNPTRTPPIEEYSNTGSIIHAYFPGYAPSGSMGTSFASPQAMADYINNLE